MAKSIEQQVDAIETFILKSVRDALLTDSFKAINKSLPSYDRAVKGAWKDAAADHFANDVPHAYRRTNAIADPSIAKISVSKVSLFDPNTISSELFITLDGEKVLDLHKKAQVTLADRDQGKPSPNFAQLIRYPWNKDAAGQLYFPAMTAPEAGVVGSMQKQQHTYLAEYLMAGPNSPNQPIVYRALGNSGGSSHDAAKGLDLMNTFLCDLGMLPVGKVEAWTYADFDPGHAGVIDSLVDDIAKRLTGSIEIVFG